VNYETFNNLDSIATPANLFMVLLYERGEKVIVNLVCNGKNCWKNHRNAKIERYSHANGGIDSGDLSRRLRKYGFDFRWENGKVVIYCMECFDKLKGAKR